MGVHITGVELTSGDGGVGCSLIYRVSHLGPVGLPATEG